MKETIGWIGVGSMGHRMSRHLVAAGYPLVVADAASTARAPEGAAVAKSNTDVAARAGTVVLSSPTARRRWPWPASSPRRNRAPSRR
jgi:3-hydroxyisobutyrate dehydrogenase-like beta-hydroxyacid dehydrogenase